MRLIKPSFEIWESTGNIDKDIERVARVCYKSEDKVTSNSAFTFVNNLIKRKHYAMLEHGTVYLRIDNKNPEFDNVINRYRLNPYSRVLLYNKVAYITTNYRVIIENKWYENLKLQCTQRKAHESRYTVHFTCDIGVGREFTRHRVMSMAQESTRYCNYSKDKFNNELTFIIPCWLDIPEGQYIYWDGDWCDINKMKIQLPEGVHKDISTFLWTLNNAETHYNFLINSGWRPQQARSVLPLATKSELVLTGFRDQWQHFFDLRAIGTTGIPHPQAKELAEPLMQEFNKRNYLYPINDKIKIEHCNYYE